MDSAVSLTLLRKVLNPENIFAFYLPYKTSNEESREHAYMISEFNNVKSSMNGDDLLGWLDTNKARLDTDKP